MRCDLDQISGSHTLPSPAVLVPDSSQRAHCSSAPPIKMSGLPRIQVDDIGLRGASWASLGPSGDPWQLRQLLRPVPFYGTVPCGQQGAWAWGRKGWTPHSLTLCGRTLLRGLCSCQPFRTEARGGDLNSLRWFMSVLRPGMLA